MSTINGRACVANGRNLLTGTSSDLKTKQITNVYNVGPQATNGAFKIKVVKRQKYTYRAWLDNTHGTNQAFVNIRFSPTIDGGQSISLSLGTRVNKGEIGYSTSVITPPEDGYIMLIPFSYAQPETALAGWKEEKLEKGSIATPWTPAPVDKVFSNGRQVYGRNLYLNSKAIDDYYAKNRIGIKVTVEPFNSTTSMWHIVAEQGIGSPSGIYLPDYANGKTPDNSDWSYSADVKGTGKVQTFGIENGSMNPIVGTVGTEWSRISQTGHVDNEHKTLVMYFDCNSSPLDVYIKLPKLETGTTPTPWTPAPEDVM